MGAETILLKCFFCPKTEKLRKKDSLGNQHHQYGLIGNLIRNVKTSRITRPSLQIIAGDAANQAQNYDIDKMPVPSVLYSEGKYAATYHGVFVTPHVMFAGNVTDIETLGLRQNYNDRKPFDSAGTSMKIADWFH